MSGEAENMYLHYHRQYDDEGEFFYAVHEYKTLKQDMKDLSLIHI